MSFSPGTIVKARGREWAVLPTPSDSPPQSLYLRPLAGSEIECTVIHTGLEKVENAQFAMPTADDLGDALSGTLLRNAARLSVRSGAGPFRSFGRIAVTPRPYQLTPLLLALRQPTVRLFVADDVGIGKTVEAMLVARELLDRGEISRFTVLCPRQLAEQWQRELHEKMHIEAEIVLPSTAPRLERQCEGTHQSIFERFPFTVVSIDFIKSDKHRDEFLRSCPEFLIVDEAHTCANPGEKKAAMQQRRYSLLEALASDSQRHILFLSATPHSGNPMAFRSLMTLLNKELHALPEELQGHENESNRRKLAQYFVQRRRGDILKFLGEDTRFPKRITRDETYSLSAKFLDFQKDVLAYARETVVDAESNKRRQRVRWWSALGLLLALSSSPVAAAATLKVRAQAAEGLTDAEIDEKGRASTLEIADEDDPQEFVPGALPGSSSEENENGDIVYNKTEAQRLADFSKRAQNLSGYKNDPKLQLLGKELKRLIEDKFHPVVFCRFIATVEYVERELKESGVLPLGTEVVGITGTMGPEEREAALDRLGDSDGARVLVCTDCLSEGINLQHLFDAVVHYDLSWNPNRHEQREGRVDRFGQQSTDVRVLTVSCDNNIVDTTVLKVLLEKHRAIRSSLGISVPVPATAEKLVAQVFENVIKKSDKLKAKEVSLEDFWENGAGDSKELYTEIAAEWDAAERREKQSQTMFAQQTIKVDEVEREVRAMRAALGNEAAVEQFVSTVLNTQCTAQALQQQKNGIYRLTTEHLAQNVREILPDALLKQKRPHVAFDSARSGEALVLSRTHPVTEALAQHILANALDAHGQSYARRCGVMRTRSVMERVTEIVLRCRYELQRLGSEPCLVEEVISLACSGLPTANEKPQWFDSSFTEKLSNALPVGNIPDPIKKKNITDALRGLIEWQMHLNLATEERARVLLDSHKRVRAQTATTNISVKPVLPPDILGVYVFLPEAQV